MTSTLNCESRHSYSWWWDSHISPKNSKWLQDNLTDIDGKVRSMIKIINEDADSFARRADMYYRKRPELMKLVEEFYRAYRALAERYDHATGELRIAHRTMIEAFPNQDSFMSGDDPDDMNRESDDGLNKNGLKKLNEIFQTGEAVLRELKTAEERLRKGNLQEEKVKDFNPKQASKLTSDKNRNLDLRTMILNQSEQAGKVEAEMQRLKEALAQMEAERDATCSQYQHSLEKLKNLETELNLAQVEAKELDKHASEAQIEVKELKESLKNMEVERDYNLCQFKEASERLASLEAMANAAVEAKQDLSRVEIEKEGALAQYHESLDKISELEEKLRLADENAKMRYEQNERAEHEIKALKNDLSRLHKEKEDAYLQYQQCLETISKLQNELMELKEEVERLKGEILLGSAQLKCAEEQCALLEEINQSLNLEASDLVQEIAAKDKQLSEKQTELEKLMIGLQTEQSSFNHVEGMLHSLQSMNLQSQEEQRSLALELRDGLELLRGLEQSKQDLELEIHGLREQNQWLNDKQDEIKSLQEIKEKLEVEVKRQSDQNDVLQKQFDRLKEEMEDLYKKYSDLILQVESFGIDPKCLKSSIKDLQEENSRLMQISNEGKTENEGLLRRLQDMESSFADLKVELESSKEKMKTLQQSCSALSGEKTTVMAEKTALLSQLKIITDSMQKLLENNVTLDKSLQGANIELEGLRVKSKGLEDFCQYLKDEKSGLVTERNGLVFRLECVEKNLEELATRFTELKEKYVSIEEDRDSTRVQVAELRISLSAEKQERQSLVVSNETRLSGLEDNIRRLQEENKCRKNDFEEQLEKAVNAQLEIFILQKFMKDMEEKHFSLLAECSKHAEAAKYSEKIISELESENMIQHLDTEYLLDRVDNLRRGISQVLKALEIDHVSEGDPEVFLPFVRGKIKEIGRSISNGKDENQRLLIQNEVLSAVITQLSLDGKELETRKGAVDHEFFLLNQQYVMLQDKLSAIEEEKHMLEEQNSGTIQELERVSNEMCSLREAFADLANEARSLEENNAIKETENKQLKELIHQLEKKNQELNVCAEWLFQKCSAERERCNMKEAELSECRERQEKEMASLQEENGRLESEVVVLSEEIEACRTREVILGSELHEKSSEFALWEAEATSFYFDLQVSSVREVVLENKIHEISGLYQDLKNKMDAYMPAIFSIKDNISCLEQTPVLRKKLHCNSARKQQVVESKEFANPEEQIQQPDDGLLALQELQSRLKAIESILAVEEISTQECVNAKKKSKSAINQSEKLEFSTNPPGTSDLRCRTQMKDIPLDHVADILSSSSGRRGSGRFSNGSKRGPTHIKTRSRTPPSWSDDNMHIELEIGDLFNSTPNEIEKELVVDNLEVSKNVSKQGKQSMAITKRLASDAQKLASLQVSVQELRRKIENNKKSKTTKSEHKRLEVQLQDVENSVMQLVNVNTKLSCSMDQAEEIEVERALTVNVLDQARRDSEKIECLQLEMQKIEYILVTLDDDKANKSNIIVKSRFSRAHTGIILREFVYNRGRRSRKNKASRFCCFRPSPSLHREV